MTVCGACRAELRPGAGWCAHCGSAAVGPSPTAEPPRSGVGGRTLAAAVGAAVLVGCCVTVALVRPWEQAAAAPPAAAASSTEATPTGEPVPTGTVAPSPPADAPTALTALTALTARSAADSAAAEQLVGYWVPQVSAKRQGLAVNGHVYSDQDVLADHRAWVARFPDALLVRSADFSTFASPGFWVTVVDQPFGTPQDANAWCAAQQLGLDDCFAKRLSHTLPPAGNTVHR